MVTDLRKDYSEGELPAFLHANLGSPCFDVTTEKRQLNGGNMNEKRTITHSDLRQFPGDSVRYRSIHPRVICTPGIQYLAENAGAFWLVNTIASYYSSPEMRKAVEQDIRVADMQVWRLDVRDQTGVLTARADAGEPSFIRQVIEYTDFPLDRVDIWGVSNSVHTTLMLPSEY